MAIPISDDNSDEGRKSRLFFYLGDDKLMVLFLFILSKYKNCEYKYSERKWDMEEFEFTLGYDLRVCTRWKFSKMF